MSRSTPSGRRLHGLAAATSALAIGIAGVGASALPSAASAPPDAPPAVLGADSASLTVTLITGDRVTVQNLADGTRAVEVDTADPGAGVRTFDIGGQLYVVPEEAQEYLAAGVLDGDLFNVSKLIEYGYDDASVDATPVIVEQSDTAARSSAPLPGIELTTPLPSVDGSAGTISHDGSEALWDALTSAPQARTLSGKPQLAGGIETVNLDGKVTATLDSSAPYVDAPEAWELGYTGEGVTVAVLDSGYDDTHPDLAGRVSPDSASFVPGEEVAADPNGHGTHVASTIAGTGAASDGAQRGVADGADLLIGKVLDAQGYGQDSWIISAMEWAAERAPIVSMSLGSQQASDGTDLMAAALDRISAETGALFVVAAGNSSSPETIGSPGSAASALTVGSVDDPSGALSWFSSQGPLLRSGALKPDLSGPGNDVTAARSADSDGEGAYVSMSGTSMATPHVAGAAAILKQRNPEYTAAQLKAALTSSAADLGLTPYQAGTGLLDVDAALQAPVVASGSGDFGMLVWGEEPAPVTRTIEYANRTSEEVTLELAASLADTTPGSEGGEDPLSAPASDALTMDAASLTIPAGDTRAVTLTVDPAKIPAGTQLSGALVASTGSGPVARTALGAIAEAERYDLTLTATDFAGEPTLAYAWMWNAETGWFAPVPVDGETTLRLPGGTYAAMSFLELPRTPDTVASVLVGDPDIVLDQARSVALDARTAEQITVDVGERGLDSTFRRVDYTVDGFAGSATMPVWVDELWAQPLESDGADFGFTTRWRLQQPTLSLRAGRLALDVIPQAGSTLLDGRLRATAVDAGTGTAEEFAAAGAQGKVAVVTRSDAVSPSARAANAVAAGVELLIVANDADGELSEWVGAEDYTTPTVIPVAGVSGVQGRELRSAIASKHVTVEGRGIANADEIWDIARYSSGSIPSDLAYEPRRLARIDTTYYGPAEELGEFRYDFVPGTQFGSGFAMRASRGMERTEWVSTESVEWYQNTTITSAQWNMRDVKRSYRAGDRTGASYFGAIVRPFVGPGYWAPFRSGDGMQVNLPSWADGGSPSHTGGIDMYAGIPGVMQQLDLYVNGELIGSGTDQAVTAWDLPDGESDVRVVNATTHDGTYLSGSTATRSEWSFRSSGAADDYTRQLLPMIQAFYDVELDDDGRAGGDRRKRSPIALGLEVGHVGGATGAAKIASTTLEWRTANGEWAPVTLKPAKTDAPSGPTEPPADGFAQERSFVSAFEAKIPVSDEGGWIDLRVTATDAAGSTFSQEIVRAFEATPAKGSGDGHEGDGHGGQRPGWPGHGGGRPWR